MTIPASSMFGSNVVFNESNPSDKVIEIHLNDFQDTSNGGDIIGGVGIDDPTTWTAANFDEKASSLLSAITILHLQKQPTENTDPTNGTYIDFDPNFDKAFVNRGGTAQIRYRKKVDVYTGDSTTSLDPDNVAGA